MGLGPAAVKLNLELWQRGLFKEVRSVLDFGSQELQLDEQHFRALLESTGIAYAQDRFRPWYFPDHPRCPSAPFYDLLGVEDVVQLDLNGDHGALPLDLNEPIEDPGLLDRFDLVSDYGNNEHVFNVAEAYRSMHRVTRRGGLIVIVQARYGGNGYFLFDAPFFEEVAAANRYEILFSSYVLASRRSACGTFDEFHVPMAAQLLDLLDWSRLGSISVCYVFRKTSDQDFVVPYQWGHDPHAPHGHRLQFLQESNARWYEARPEATLDETRSIDLAKHLVTRTVGAARRRYRRARR